MRKWVIVAALVAWVGAWASRREYRTVSKVNHYKGWRLVWSDEFDIPGAPAEHWTYEHGYVRNNEEQWYQEQNATVRDGALVIEGRRETVENFLYTSASLNTRRSFHFMYGRVEVRAKIPVATGAWPAIWLLGNRREWPENGEIDIMEYYIKYGKPSILANACWGSGKRWVAEWNTGAIPFTHFTDRDPRWADKYHVRRMDWDEQWIRIYLDGELLNEIDLSLTQNRGQEFNPFSNSEPHFGHYLLLNLAMGSSGGPVDESQLPFLYYIDYVRVYQRVH